MSFPASTGVDVPPRVQAMSQAGTDRAAQPPPAAARLDSLWLDDQFTRIVDECRRQVEQFGHTAASDAERDPILFAGDMLNRARAIQESLHFGKGADLIRRRCIKLAALTLALIERIDMEDRPDGR